MIELVLATANAHKVAEFQALFDSAAAEARVHPFDGPSPVESGTTFAENALIKARAAAAHTEMIAFADDSGLCVDVLGGAPGIFSARWAGTSTDDVRNRSLLLEQLSDVADPHRRAHFHCEIALVVPASSDPDGLGGELTVSGQWHGHLVTEAAGEHGFGYDPIFVPDGFAITAAQLKPEVKNEHSHRARAFTEFIAVLRDVLRVEAGE